MGPGYGMYFVAQMALLIVFAWRSVLFRRQQLRDAGLAPDADWLDARKSGRLPWTAFVTRQANPQTERLRRLFWASWIAFAIHIFVGPWLWGVIAQSFGGR